MIDERLEEQASLHVLGGLSAEETRDFETELRQNADLRKLVAELGVVTEAVAGTAPLVAPPPALRHKILGQVGPRENIVPFPVQPRSNPFVVWLPWALAACLAVVCWVQTLNQNSLQTHIKSLTQTAEALSSATNDLQQTIAELRASKDLSNLRVAVLGALLKEEPKAVAVSLWDDKSQSGELIVENMTPLPSDKDYELWVIDPQYATPVAAGTFQVDAEGKGRVQFKANQPIKTAGKFAVTREAKGGSPTPKGTMVLIGG